MAWSLVGQSACIAFVVYALILLIGTCYTMRLVVDSGRSVNINFGFYPHLVGLASGIFYFLVRF